MSLKRKYSDSGVNGRTVPEPARTITSESAIKPRKKAKRESKDSSLSSTSNPDIFSAKSKSENTVCSPQSSTAASGPTELVSDLDSESSSAISTSSSDDNGDDECDDEYDDESIDDLRETGSEESSEDLESSNEEGIGQSDTSSNISIETDSDPDEVVTLRPGKKPKMRPPSTRKSNSLLKRLQAFLPEMQNANQELEQDRIEGRLEQRRIENVDEGEERVIEMDLELGVLENKKRCDGVGSNDEEVAEVAEVETGIDILGRLMRREPKSFSIDEVE